VITSVGFGGIDAPLHRGHERTEHLRVAGITPREVVEQRDARWVGADGHDVPDRFVDDGPRHSVRVVHPVPGVDADAHRRSGGGVGTARAEHGRVGRSVVCYAGIGPPDRRAEHLVVVAPDDVGVGPQRRVREQREQRRACVDRVAADGARRRDGGDDGGERP
jgi:hypothetical protein